ncbi:hypothetical protein HF072_00595 [Bacillus sp. RO3]|nr:hypothetical protein [Bacillus sp. RO3]
MRYVVNLYYSIDGNKTLQTNEFHCRKGDLVLKIHSWIRKIKMETGYRETSIEKVIVNEEYDIAETVRNYKVVIDDSWIPF